MKEVSDLVSEVELAKQLKPPLTDQQRVQLVKDLYARAWTLARLRRAAEAVKLKDTYATIALQYWTDGDYICGEDLEEERAAISRMLERARVEIDRMRREDFWDEITKEINRQIAVIDSKLSPEGRERESEIVVLRGRRRAEREFDLASERLERMAQSQRKRQLKLYKQQAGEMDQATRRKLWDRAVEMGLFKNYDQYMVASTRSFISELAPVFDEWAHIVP